MHWQADFFYHCATWKALLLKKTLEERSWWHLWEKKKRHNLTSHQLHDHRRFKRQMSENEYYPPGYLYILLAFIGEKEHLKGRGKDKFSTLASSFTSDYVRVAEAESEGSFCLGQLLSLVCTCVCAQGHHHVLWIISHTVSTWCWKFMGFFIFWKDSQLSFKGISFSENLLPTGPFYSSVLKHREERCN